MAIRSAELRTLQQALHKDHPLHNTRLSVLHIRTFMGEMPENIGRCKALAIKPKRHTCTASTPLQSKTANTGCPNTEAIAQPN